MIESFRDKRLRLLYERGDPRRLPPELIGRIESILARLDVASSIDDMDLFSYRLHQLKGDLEGCWSVTVRSNWRIIFQFQAGNAYDVDLVDYH